MGLRIFASNWQNHNFCRHMKKSTFYIFLRDPDFANPYSSLQIHTDPYKSILVSGILPLALMRKYAGVLPQPLLASFLPSFTSSSLCPLTLSERSFSRCNGMWRTASVSEWCKPHVCVRHSVSLLCSLSFYLQLSIGGPFTWCDAVHVLHVRVHARTCAYETLP